MQKGADFVNAISKKRGGSRPGAGRPATGAMPNRTIRMTDTEYELAAEDSENWNEKERQILQEIANSDPYQNQTTRIKSSSRGSGRMFYASKNEPKFLFHESASGINIGLI